VICLKVKEKIADILALTNSYVKRKDAAGNLLDTSIKSRMVLHGVIIQVHQLFAITLFLVGREGRVLTLHFITKCMLCLTKISIFKDWEEL
jgi:hypothetical protein